MDAKKLIEALREVLECEKDRDDARARYMEGGGHDWGYHGFHHDQLCDAAARELQAALDAAIEDRVRAVLAEMELHRPSSVNA